MTSNVQIAIHNFVKAAILNKNTFPLLFAQKPYFFLSHSSLSLSLARCSCSLIIVRCPMDVCFSERSFRETSQMHSTFIRSLCWPVIWINIKHAALKRKKKFLLFSCLHLNRFALFSHGANQPNGFKIFARMKYEAYKKKNRRIRRKRRNKL